MTPPNSFIKRPHPLSEVCSDSSFSVFSTFPVSSCIDSQEYVKYYPQNSLNPGSEISFNITNAGSYFHNFSDAHFVLRLALDVNSEAIPTTPATPTDGG